ncbi:DUF1294 domain-containing protein [Clostridium magnum]|uniref:DUF1294 domain-containing protein n=1 Tax=Clostridium magnum DSM 2767 TaxID=1121326 RepID=A0A162SGV6_9CLOT|nr:DUF1294 domain-containing protein [Clostridium magnum]KZL91237.1 hypothetical protein CLMAG_29950 [Clostridium magnum DSM 2767]SHI33969.1 Uncharacterized membrane protein YsdA, DUF1294 family [Clostridium magnum DSM 2767]
MKIFLYYVLIINLYGVLLMYSDKKKSIKSKWRVPESNLFFVASIFGSLGIFLGMHIFRHKTKHKKFVFLIPLICLVQIYVLFKFII